MMNDTDLIKYFNDKLMQMSGIPVSFFGKGKDFEKERQIKLRNKKINKLLNK